MGSAFGFGLLAGSSFVIGAIVALRAQVNEFLLGSIMAVGSGALMAAVAYELVDDAGQLAFGSGRIAIGLVLGSAAIMLGRKVAGPEDSRTGDELRIHDVIDPVMAIVPEAIVIVGSMVGGHGVSLAVITAVFVCGIPESIWWTERLRARGIAARTIVMWSAGIMVVCGATAGLVHRLLDDSSGYLVAFVLAAAGGAVLTDIGADLLPEARSRAGEITGFGVVVGFGVVFSLVQLSH